MKRSIEHLPPHIVPALAPTLLGIYHPVRLLLTTPSYTFNARFTPPNAPSSARQGFPDPTGRTDRIFRHDDHKFEWTVDEFQSWCRQAAAEWGYELEEMGDIGKPLEDDPWGRDEACGGASLVVSFRRKEDDAEDREKKGRITLAALGLDGEAHELLATHQHAAHTLSKRTPTTESLQDIGNMVKARMEQYREVFMTIEEIWFEKDVAVLCGGWIEVLLRAVQEYGGGLRLIKPGEGQEKGWTVELVGGINDPQMLRRLEPGETSAALIPENWIPGEDDSEDDWRPSAASTSTGADGDVSWNESEDDEENPRMVVGAWDRDGQAQMSASEWDNGSGWGAGG